MKRMILVGLSLVLALGVVVTPAAATPTEDLTALADYFPNGTPVFFAFRTDDDFVDELDSLVDTLRDALPSGVLPPFSLRDALDEGMMEFGGADATFDNTVRTWLGDTVAVGIVSLDSAMTGMGGDPPMLIAIDITDRDAALDFIEQSYAMNGVDIDTEAAGDYTVVTPERPDNAFFAVGDDVALLSNEQDLLPLNSDFRSLADDAEFTDSVATLPASDYNMVLALDLQDMVSMSYQMMQMMMENEDVGPMGDIMTDLAPLYANYPRQTLGLTILDGNALTLDFVQGAIDYSALEGTVFEAGTVMIDAPAVDLAFARHIPADALFTIQGTSFGNALKYGIDAFALAAEMGMQQSITAQRYGGPDRDDDVPAFAEEMDANDFKAFIDLAFAGMTGLNLQEDVLPHLNGNAAIFGRVLPSEATNYTYDTALVFEVTDAEAMQAIVDQIIVALDRYEADYTAEGDLLVIPGVIRGFFPQRFQEDLDADPQFDFVISLTDDVFAIGSREAVEFAITNDGDALADDPAFIAAQAYVLDGSQQVGYVGFGAIGDLINDVMSQLPESRQDTTVGAVLMAFDAVSSASYSAKTVEDGSSVGRLVLTLAD